MTIVQSTPEAFVWVGIDVAKDRHEALIEAPGWRSRKRVRVQNAAEDFRSFAEFLHSLGFPVRIGFEPTSNYHRALAYFLHSEGFELQLISSLALARTREAMHNSWDKNDPKDAQVILHLLKSGLTQHYHDPIVHNLNDLQELSKTHHQVSLEKTRTQHRLLTHYLPLYFPEIARYHSSARSEWLWSLLIAQPHLEQPHPAKLRPSTRPRGHGERSPREADGGGATALQSVEEILIFLHVKRTKLS
jgi:transposase